MVFKVSSTDSWDRGKRPFLEEHEVKVIFHNSTKASFAFLTVLTFAVEMLAWGYLAASCLELDGIFRTLMGALS